jgi:hypothetical protein
MADRDNLSVEIFVSVNSCRMRDRQYIAVPVPCCHSSSRPSDGGGGVAVATQPASALPLWHRLILAFVASVSRLVRPRHRQQPLRPATPPPVRLITRHDFAQPLRASAEGGVFNFRVYVRLTWTSVNIHRNASTAAIAQNTSDILGEIHEFSREFAGLLRPHRVTELQLLINERLKQAFGPFIIEGGRLECRVRARVEPDERLVDRLAAHARRLIDVENEHQLRKQRAKLMHDLADEWRVMLELLREHPMTAHANRLTDKDFADVMDVIDGMTRGRGDSTDRLVRLLTPTDNGHSPPP